MGTPFSAREATDLHVASAFRAFRVACGLKLRDVAAVLGVKPGTVHKYERGEIRIFPETLVRAAVLFGVPVKDFFPGAQVLGRRPKVRAHHERIARTAAFVADIRRIESGEMRDALVRVTRLMLEGQPSA